ncbi:hypothetical protein O181_056027 [Austropuccinia psidii MF-1]|uniref:Uncharacterized protein n=1 Tax=Austropuccinia psidii MF-1 TaxID=1389203 RepID=A0A9Q3HU27_9BASI|nr:hypothetical protein [Austropuccinia psidii MF-1]
MSSSKPHKSRSGSVLDSDSESSREYVQTKSPLITNIPLTTPIASSINLSGLIIDVGNPKAQTSSTWSIPNISVTPIPPNPTNTQMHVLIPDPFGQSKQPTLNIPSGSQVHLGNEKRVYGRQQKRQLQNVTLSHMAPKGKSVSSQEPIEDRDELYASSPLVYKEKVNGCHHPYASKPRTAHAISSREKTWDDADENMSPTQSDRNESPRREIFTAHEQGAQSNSEFIHPQMLLAWSMLNQSAMRQQMTKAHKAHNVAKPASHKEQQKWLKAEFPGNVHGMRSAVHSHCLFLLKVRYKDFSALPAPPRTEERDIAI